MREVAGGWRRQGEGIGLVPTMGALHAGHLSLVGASTAANRRTVVSIFVNPLQFGAGEDFERYPRTFDRDREALAGFDVAAIFAPSVSEMYPAGATTRVTVGELDAVLEGASRPGHFEGVASVVCKLFWAVGPDRAYFGQKDAQQAAVISRMASDLGTGIAIEVCPIVREPDGLALSSRNAYLKPEERTAALSLSRALKAADGAYRAGEREPGALRSAMLRELERESLVTPDYADAIDPADFRSAGRLAVVAARVGTTRLIDNHLLGEPF